MEDGKHTQYGSSSSKIVSEDVWGGFQNLQAPLINNDGLIEQTNVTTPPLLRRVFSTRDDLQWMQMRGSVVCVGVEMKFEFAPNVVYYYTGTGIVLDTRLVLTVASLFEAPQRRKELGEPTVRINITTDIAPGPNKLVRGSNSNSTRANVVAWGPGVDLGDLVLPHKYFSRQNTDIETNLALLKTKNEIPNNHPIFPHYRRKGSKFLQLCTYNQIPVFNTSTSQCQCGDQSIGCDSTSTSTQSNVALAQFARFETTLNNTQKRPRTAPENPSTSSEGLSASIVRFSTQIRGRRPARPRARRASGSDLGDNEARQSSTPVISHSVLHEIQQLYSPDKQPTIPDLEKYIERLQPGKFSVASTSLWEGVKYKPYHMTFGSSIRERKIADCRKVTSDFYSSCICYRISTLGGSIGGALCIDGKWVGIHMGQVKYLEVEETENGVQEMQVLNEHSCGIGLWLDSRKASQWLRINVPLYCEMKKRPRWVQFGM